MGAAGLRSKLGQLPGRWLARHVVPYRIDGPVVSITFDDFPGSALATGGRILETHGIAGTFYTIFGQPNAQSPSGPLGGLTDFAQCVASGHEIACHTFDHLDCSRASAGEIAASLARNQAAARDAGLPPLRHFAYPFGRYSVAAKKTAMQHYSSARAILRGVNAGNVDLSLLKSVPLYSRPEAPDLTRYFRALQFRPGWLILYTHDVAKQPSPFGCTPEKLRLAIRLAREIGAPILPVGAVVEKLFASAKSKAGGENPQSGENQRHGESPQTRIDASHAR
jgi:peptidoglycan/xylan/chitin deacetylase (PgdA/CDA1 family)